ncbi:sodium-independent sulfate anion transporter isoform X2 [Coturnix japonica]|uniref:sodium-independent sulfate anion transporter isoform X2 n=1 Tax=Coturnix japonica TaxID=93934 RepID=UPI000776F8C7|nr:sodium-independent sulfate anion transporter isoform X2 [Coturnix japonica]
MWGPRQPGQRWWQRAMRRRLPVLGWLPRYSLTCLRLDVTAGITVGLTVVPQALAYAEVAGLPVQYGLYSSFVGCFVYCLLGTAKDVTLGPTAIMSLLVSSYTFHDPTYAVLLAFLSGCIQLAMGLLHLGFLLDFVSCPVIKGFTSAASITISFNQVKNILGLQGIPRQFFLQVYETLRRIGETRAGDAILGLSCLAALAGLRAMKSRLHPTASMEPLATRASVLLVRSCATARNALVVLAAGLVAYSFQVSGSQPLMLTGSVPRGLPPFDPPPFSKAVPNGTVPFGRMVQDMGAGLAVVPLVGVLETVAIAKAFASQNDYRIDANQELLAMGTANLLGSFFSSYPITGSFGRTAVNAQTGVCTPMGGLITGTLVLLSLAYLTSLFCYIPKAALAAVIISAVIPMFDARIFRTLWRVKRLDLIPLCVTFLLCFWEVQYGIMAGVLVSGILLLYSVARPPIKVLEQGVLLVQPGSSLHFPAADHLQDIIRDRALAASPPRSVILDCHHVSTIDYTAVVGLAELLQDLHKHGISLVFCSLQSSPAPISLPPGPGSSSPAGRRLGGIPTFSQLGGGRAYPVRQSSGVGLALCPKSWIHDPRGCTPRAYKCSQCLGEETPGQRSNLMDPSVPWG